MRRWRAANLDKARAMERATYYRHKEKYLAQKKADYHAKPVLYRLRAIGFVGDILQRLEDEYKLGCAYCGTKERLEIDHKMPRSRGGSNLEENLQWLCGLCNRAKNNLTDEEFFAHLKRILER